MYKDIKKETLSEQVEIFLELGTLAGLEKEIIQRHARKERRIKDRKADIRNKREAKRWAMSQWEV